jgi:hypothetical protein
MKTKLTAEKILERFDHMFRKRKLPASVTSMYWGLQIQPGWYNIIWDMCLKIEKILKLTKNTKFAFRQIKEKFGAGRFYCSGSNDKIDRIIHKAERLCGKTCEVCGRPGKVEDVCGWKVAVCSVHKKRM